MSAKLLSSDVGRQASAAPKRRVLWAAVERYRARLSAFLFALGFVVCGAASVLLGQDNNWDLCNYHYYNPYAFITDRIGFDFAPAQRQSFLNPLLDLPFYFGSTYLNPRLFAFLMGGVHGLSFGLLFAVSTVVFRNWAPNARLGVSVLAAGLGLYGPIFIGELGASENDTLIGLFVLTSLLLLVKGLATGRSLAAPASRKGLLVASLVFGMGTGLKPTVAPYALATAVALLAVDRSWRSRVTILSTWSVAFLAGFLITNGYWMAKLWHEYRNPFFPFYNDIFRSPWANDSSYADRALVPGTVWEALARPFAFAYRSEYATGQYEFRDVRYAAFFVLLALIVFVWAFRRTLARKKAHRLPLQSLSVEARFLLVFFVASFVVWEAAFSIFRYVATLEALAPLLLVILACDLGRRTAVRAAVVTAIFVVTALAVRPMDQPRLPFGDSFWEVKVSGDAVPNPQNSVIFLANPRPWAYLVPMFPPEVRWVGMNNNLTKVIDQTRMQVEIRQLALSHPGDMFLLSRHRPSVWYEYDRKLLAHYGLEVVEDKWWPIESKHSRPGLRLWPLRRR